MSIEFLRLLKNYLKIKENILRKKLTVLVLLIVSLNLFSQKSNYSYQLPSSFQLISDNDDVNGINQLNFKRKRFAGNTIYAEIGGFGYYYTINYELTFQSMDRRNMNFRIGAGVMPETEGDIKGTKISVPALLNLAFGETNQFEIGVGITYRTFIENEIIPSASIGFRHQKAFGGFMYRFAFTPTIETDDAGYKIINFWGGLSLGFAF